MGEHGQRWIRFPRGVALAVVAWAAVSSALLQGLLFRYGSVDLDDLDYRNQAGALRHGHITLSAATHTPYFVPYLTGVHDGRIVFTHQPLWPAFIAVFDLVHAPTELVVAASAALFAVAACVLVSELFDDTPLATVTLAFVALSPMVVVQSGTLLGYLPTLTLGVATTALVLRAVRRPRRSLAAAAGFVGGLLVFNRPFDAVLFVVPLLVYAVAVRRRIPLGSMIGWAALGAAVPVGVLLAYNAAVMGSVATFPYTVHPQDTIGFGLRASFGPTGFHFGLPQAWAGLVHNTGQAVRWTAGGVVGLGLAVVGLVANRHDPRLWTVASWVVLFPAGYFFFWTTWNIANFGLIGPLGPLYYLPSLAALAILAGAGAVAVWRWNRIGAGAVLVAALVLSALTFQSSWSTNRSTLDANRSSARLLDRPPVTPRLVITPPSFPGDPYLREQNPPDLVGPVLYAMSPSMTETLGLLESRPGVQAYRVESLKPFNGVFGPSATRLTPTRVEQAPEVRVTLRFRAPAREASFPISAYCRTADTGGAPRQVALTPVDGAYTVTWSITPAGVSTDGTSCPLPSGPATQLAVGFWESGNGSVGHGSYEYRYAVRTDGTSSVSLLVPGEPWRRYVFPGDKVAESNEDLTGVLTAQVGAG